MSLVCTDHPISKDGDDKLDFVRYRNVICGLIDQNTPLTLTPLTIGVYGSWGSGKTSLMKLIETHAKEKHLTIWFDAWKYDKETVLWRALLLKILHSIRSSFPQGKSHADIDALEDRLYRTVEREELGNLQINWPELLKGSVEAGLHLTLSLVPGLNLMQDVIKEIGKQVTTKDPTTILNSIQRGKKRIYLEQIETLEQFQNQFHSIIEAYCESNNQLRLVVFIDDLDRCLPEKAIEVLEAIKLFLDVEKCFYILGMDPKIIARAIEHKYRDFNTGVDKSFALQGTATFDGVCYLEKIVQIPFFLPSITQDKMKGFVEGLLPGIESECVDVFVQGLGDNPRKVKRAINTFVISIEFLRDKGEEITLAYQVQLAKVVVIQNSFPDLYSILKHNPPLLRKLEFHYRASRKSSSQNQEQDFVPLPPALRVYQDQNILSAIFNMHTNVEAELFQNTGDEVIQKYFTLSSTLAQPDSHLSSLVVDGFPTYIEPALVHIQTNGHNFHIGRYPVTYREYQCFIASRSTNLQTQPSSGKYDDHPAVFVTWNDVSEYCKWLSAQTGKTYRLPTKEEWEAAASPKNGGEYPWGSAPNFSSHPSANTAELGYKSTTPVGQFSPQGDSQWGCADMAGNVWEWCSTPKEKGYLMKGGSFSDPLNDAKWNNDTVWSFAERSYDNVGFRIILDESSD